MKNATRVAVLATAIALVATGLLAWTAVAQGDSAVARLRDASGNQVGTVKVSELRSGDVEVQATVQGLPPGFHGFHVHAIGQCDPPDFTSAGGHFNPTGNPHPSHAGDQPVLLINSDGTGRLEFVTDRYSIDDLFDADGSAYIVHANPDNYANIPTRYHSHTYDVFGPDPDTLATGDAGARLACGVPRPS
jgi:Cu-Zn family superoxide dismutase